MSLRYFLGSELQKSRVMAMIWDKFNAANHDTTGKTKKSILPQTDADWVKNKKTYNIRYTVDKETGVMTNVLIQINLAIEKSREPVVMVLHKNFKSTPKMTNQVAIGRLAKWAAIKITEPQHVISKGKKYTYPASKRGKAIAWRIANKIQKDKKIMNKSGFLSPFTDGRHRYIEKAVDKAVDRFLVGVWNEDVSKDIFNKVDRMIETI